MKIGIAGPVSVKPFEHLLSPGVRVPATYSFPLIGVLARSLVEHGHSVRVFATSDEIADPLVFDGTGIRLHVLPQRKKYRAYDFYQGERKHLLRAMRESDCDLIHAHWAYEFAAAAIDSGLPHLITAHDSPLEIWRFFWKTKAGPYWMMRALLGIRNLRRARHVTAVSPYLLGKISRLIRKAQSKTVVPNGVDLSLFDIGAARLSDGEPPGTPVVAMALEGFGRIKNASTAFLGFSQFRETHPGAILRAYGSDYEPGGMAQRWTEANCCAHGIEFRGKTPQQILFSELSGEAHILLHPSVEESFGMAPCEAMSLGIPVIGSRDAGGIPFVLDQGGILIDVTKSGSIAEALDELWRDPLRRNTLAKAAWAKAKRDFTVPRMVENYISCYERILAPA